MKIKILIALLLGYVAYGQSEKQQIGNLLDNWHMAAGNTDFETYFGMMTDDAVFIGTDAKENWQRKAFESFSKPYFDRGKAWNFTPLERNIYLADCGQLAWFDELLDTQMEICRGSGVLKKEKGQWKVAHYVLSIAVPNEDVDALVQLKKEKDSMLKATLQKTYKKSRP